MGMWGKVLQHSVRHRYEKLTKTIVSENRWGDLYWKCKTGCMENWKCKTGCMVNSSYLMTYILSILWNNTNPIFIWNTDQIKFPWNCNSIDSHPLVCSWLRAGGHTRSDCQNEGQRVCYSLQDLSSVGHAANARNRINKVKWTTLKILCTFLFLNLSLKPKCQIRTEVIAASYFWEQV